MKSLTSPGHRAGKKNPVIKSSFFHQDKRKGLKQFRTNNECKQDKGRSGNVQCGWSEIREHDKEKQDVSSVVEVGCDNDKGDFKYKIAA